MALTSLKRLILGAIIGGSTMLPLSAAHANCNATINGFPMTAEQCRLAIQTYGYVQPGHYWMDANGTWGVMGDPTPLGNIHSGAYQSRSGVYGGSGERYGNGSWIHRQDDLLGGGAVAGDGNGCIYTESWSNC
ncbi:MAG: hypothetical protein OEU92_18980 [Alphaproteobacteria bacterium]|nr:hypothetical protein [Alphaproteobacteria bacterium]